MLTLKIVIFIIASIVMLYALIFKQLSIIMYKYIDDNGASYKLEESTRQTMEKLLNNPDDPKLNKSFKNLKYILLFIGLLLFIISLVL